MADKRKITNWTEGKLDEPSQFVQTRRLRYMENGVKKVWDAVLSHDSVAILVFHKTKKSFILVKQFRPPVLMSLCRGFEERNEEILAPFIEQAYTYELCAGIVDKSLTLVDIAREEIHEECGYDVPNSSIQKLTSFRTSVGISGAQQTIYYTFVDDSQKVGEGGGIDSENIEVLYLPIEELREFLFDETKVKSAGLLFAMTWFLHKYGGEYLGNEEGNKNKN